MDPNKFKKIVDDRLILDFKDSVQANTRLSKTPREESLRFVPKKEHICEDCFKPVRYRRCHYLLKNWQTAQPYWTKSCQNCDFKAVINCAIADPAK